MGLAVQGAELASELLDDRPVVGLGRQAERLRERRGLDKARSAAWEGRTKSPPGLPPPDARTGVWSRMSSGAPKPSTLAFRRALVRLLPIDGLVDDDDPVVEVGVFTSGQPRSFSASSG